VGRDNVIKATGLRESAMLTEDENIVETSLRQYRLNDARAIVREQEPRRRLPETAVREVVGKMRGWRWLRRARPDRAARAHHHANHPRPHKGIEVGHQPAAKRRAPA
jgi:membrane protease subunit HflK